MKSNRFAVAQQVVGGLTVVLAVALLAGLAWASLAAGLLLLAAGTIAEMN